MNNNPAAQPPPETVGEPIPAEAVLPGDVLLIGGLAAVVTAHRFGHYWIHGTRQPGIALDWNACRGSARGTLFRLADETLRRLPARRS
jgi:hypothetical protein